MSGQHRSKQRPRRPHAVVIAIAALGALLFVLPLVALLWRAPWSQFGHELRDDSALTALRLSLQCSLSALVLCIVLGTPLALVLARTEFPGKRLLRALLSLPMVLPPVVGGVALLLAFGRRGLVGQWLYDWFGMRLAFTTTGVVLAETFVAMPFYVVTLEAALASVDRRFEEAAATMGAKPFTVFRTVTLPAIRPSLIAGCALSWARALGEFGATITFAANVEGVTQTIPLKVYLALETNPDGAVVLSIVLLAVSIAVLAALQDRWLGARR
ncbi:MAG: ABC transporter permease [Acidimicrobiia bacterium]